MRGSGRHLFLLGGSPYGGLLGPVADLDNFMKVYLNGGTFKGRRLLEQSSIVEMQTAQRDLHGKELVTGRPMPQRIGLGWHLNRDGETLHYYHFGGGGRFWCELRVYPELCYGIAVLGNDTSYDTEAITTYVIA